MNADERRCSGCGGVLGRDCWNESDCVWITQDMLSQGARREPDPCQGCSMVTNSMRACLGLCVGLTSVADVDARAALWQAIPSTFAAAERPPP